MTCYPLSHSCTWDIKGWERSFDTVSILHLRLSHPESWWFATHLWEGDRWVCHCCADSRTCIGPAVVQAPTQLQRPARIKNHLRLEFSRAISSSLTSFGLEWVSMVDMDKELKTALKLEIAVYISGHGYGHITRTINLLEIISTTGKYNFHIRTTSTLHKGYLKYPLQPTVTQINAYQLDCTKSLQSLLTFSPSFAIQEETAYLSENKIQAVLSDALSLPCLLAHRLKIPSVLITNFTFRQCIPVPPRCHSRRRKLGDCPRENQWDDARICIGSYCHPTPGLYSIPFRGSSHKWCTHALSTLDSISGFGSCSSGSIPYRKL